MSSCFTNVIAYLSEYEYDVPNRVRTRLGEVSCLFPNQEDSAAPLSYAETVMPRLFYSGGFMPMISNAECFYAEAEQTIQTLELIIKFKFHTNLV